MFAAGKLNNISKKGRQYAAFLFCLGESMKNIKDRLYISTVAENDVLTAENYGLGLEIAEYCTAMNMDTYFAETDKTVRKKMSRAGRFVFHGPFN